MRKLTFVIIVQTGIGYETAKYFERKKVLNFSGKLMCELSATFIVFDFDNKTAIRNNYHSTHSTNYQTMKQKRINLNKIFILFSWHDMKNNFLGYWVMSDDSKKIEEIKFDKEGKIFTVSRICSEFINNSIGELIWE